MGKGGRQKKKVNYNYDMSDEQFEKMLEEEYENNPGKPPKPTPTVIIDAEMRSGTE